MQHQDNFGVLGFRLLSGSETFLENLANVINAN
jgi:hypothetical protein